MRNITQEEFDEIYRKHGLHIKGAEGGERADFSDTDLTGIEFLCGANLCGANLCGANLCGANLRDSNLCDANLRGANLCDSNLCGANLRDSNLCGANLCDSNLCDANLRDANLCDANLRDAKNISEELWSIYARDIMYILLCTRSEVPGLRKLMVEGKVHGTQYEGECCCLVGSLNNVAKNGTYHEYCQHHIPYYQPGTHNLCEAWFLCIKEGDTPENSEFSRRVVELIDTYFPEAIPEISQA